jgi:predicted RNA binding protein YcfA (HicA-like mRNA interferase family)
VSGAEIVRALERLGFTRVRQSGSHVVMRREAKGRVVPMHPEVKVGTRRRVAASRGLGRSLHRGTARVMPGRRR